MADLSQPNGFEPGSADDHLSRLLVAGVEEVLGLYGRQKKSFMMSTGFQVGLILVVLILGTNKTVQNAVKANILFMPTVDTALDQAKMQPKKDMGGGGGGDRSPLPASRGKLPPRALRQFTPA